MAKETEAGVSAGCKMAFWRHDKQPAGDWAVLVDPILECRR